MKSKFLPIIPIDTGASCAKFISESQCAELGKYANVNIQQSQTIPKWSKVKIAGGQLMQVKHEVEIELKLAHKPFKEKFLVLKTAISITLENPFFVNMTLVFYRQKNIMQNDDLSITTNEINPQNEPGSLVRLKKIPIYTTKKKQTIAASEQIMIQCVPLLMIQMIWNQSVEWLRPTKG